GSRLLTKMSFPVGVVLVKKSCGTPTSSLSKRKGLWSKLGEFTVESTCTGGCQLKSSSTCSRYDTQMSKLATPAAFRRLPGRRLMKESQCPSRYRLGVASSAAEFTTGPRFIGGPHGCSTLARWETKRSPRPAPWGLLELK